VERAHRRVTLALLDIMVLWTEANQWTIRGPAASLANYFGDVVRGMATLKAHNRSTAVTETWATSEMNFASADEDLAVAFLSGSHWNFSSLATALVALVLGIRLIDATCDSHRARRLTHHPECTFRCVGSARFTRRRRVERPAHYWICSRCASDERHGERTHLASAIELCDVRVGVDGRDPQSLLALSR